jgi:hypothetical protein
MVPDLEPLLWIKQNLDKARNDLINIEISYCALRNKRTKYAKGIYRIIEAKRKIVQVWTEA